MEDCKKIVKKNMCNFMSCLKVPRPEWQGSLEVTAITDTEILPVCPSFKGDFGCTAATNLHHNRRKLYFPFREDFLIKKKILYL